MIEIIQQNRDALIDTFKCSRRLATRLGALMSKKVTVSTTVMEVATPGSLLEKLLLKKELLETDSPADVIGELLEHADFAELKEELPLTVIAEEQWQVIAAVEETMAEDNWGSSGDEADAPALPALFQSPSRGVVAGPEAFSGEEVARMRVNIFAGVTSQEKVAALRQFAFANVSDNEKYSVFLQAAADEDSALRSAAAKGLQHLGLEPDCADAARLLAEGQEEDALERMVDLVPGSSELARDTILMATMGALRDPDTGSDQTAKLFTSLAEIIPHLGAERTCREDILRILLEGLTSISDKNISLLSSTLRAMDNTGHGWVAEALEREIAKTNSAPHRGRLIQLMVSLNMADETKARLLEDFLKTFLELPTDTQQCQSIGIFATGAGDCGMLKLADILPRADTAHQRQIIRLLDNALRSRRSAGADARAAIARAGLELLHRAPKQVRLDILETRLCARDDIPADIRKEIAVAFLQDLRDYLHLPLSGTLENALTRLGPPAATPLLQALVEHKDTPDAATLANALGRTGESLASRNDQRSIEEAELILRELQRLTFSSSSVRDSLHLAMGRICSQSGISQPVANLVLRTIMDRIEGNRADAPTLEALGMVCRGNGADPAAMRTVSGLALKHINDMPLEPAIKVEEIEGEDVFQFGDEVDAYSTLLPACLSCLEHIALGTRTPSELRGEIIRRLLDWWQETVSLNMVWGPANTAHLTTILGKIGASDCVNDGQRVRIANILARRTSETTVLEALTVILARRDDVAELDRLAGAIALRLLRNIEDKETLNEEDHETWLRILGGIGLRGRFEIRGGGSDRLIERIIEALLSGLRIGIQDCMKHLTILRDAAILPAAHQARLEDELRAFTTIMKTS